MPNSNDWANDQLNYRLPCDEELALIGEVVVLFGALEERLGALVTSLLEVRGMAASLLLSRLSFSNKLDLASCLVADRYEGKKRERARSWIKTAEKMNDQRNAVVHSLWIARPGVPDSTVRIEHRRSRTRGFTTARVRTTSAHLRAIIKSIREALIFVDVLPAATFRPRSDGGFTVERDKLRPINSKIQHR